MTRQRTRRSPSVPPADGELASVNNPKSGQNHEATDTDGLEGEIVMMRKRIRQLDGLMDQLPEPSLEEMGKMLSVLGAACIRLSGLLQHEDKRHEGEANSVSARDRALAEALKELGI